MLGFRSPKIYLAGLLAALLVLGTWISSPGSARADVKKVVITGTVVNLRSGPGTGYSKIGQVSKGAGFDVLNEKAGWYQLLLDNGKTGWVIGTYAEISAAPSSRSPSPSPQKTVTVKVDGLNVRNGPGTSYKKIAVLNQGREMTVVKESDEWFYVNLGNGNFGWVAGWLVTVKTSGPSPGEISKPDVSGGTDSGSSSPQNQTARVTGTVVNVRVAPGTSYGIIGQVKKDDRLPVLGQKADWIQVRLADGSTGWMASSFAVVENQAAGSGAPKPPTGDPKPSAGGSGSEGSTEPPIPPAQNTQSGQYLVITQDNVNIRSGPSVDFPVVRTLNTGVHLPKVGQDGTWYQVELPGSVKGWVASWLTEEHTLSLPPSRGDLPPTPPAQETGEAADPGDAGGSGSDPDEEQAPAMPPYEISGVGLTQSANGIDSLVIQSKGEIQYRIFALKDPDRLVIDLEDSLVTSAQDLAPESQFAKTVRTAQNSVSPMVVRVVVDLNKVAAYDPQLSPDRRTLTVALSEPTLKGKVIVVDAGHGGYDPGAMGVTGLQEKNYNLSTALLVRDKLRQKGAQVTMTREDDTFISLLNRAEVANNLSADVFVSIHANFSDREQTQGTSTYYYAPSSDPTLYAQAGQRAKLAEAVQSSLLKQIGTVDMGTQTANFSVLRNTKMPSILVETAFLSNKGDEALLKSNDFREKVAQGVVDGLLQYFAAQP